MKNDEEFENKLELSLELQKNKEIVGFDLVGQEDIGTPLIDYIPQLLDAVSKNVRFFFHAGETGKNLYQVYLFMDVL